MGNKNIETIFGERLCFKPKTTEGATKSLKILSDSVALIKSKIQSPMLVGQESELLEIVKTYIDSLRLLKLYDDQQLSIGKLKSKSIFTLDYQTTIQNIYDLKTRLLNQSLASKTSGWK